MNKFLSVSFFLFFGSLGVLSAQEVVVGLSNNPVLQHLNDLDPKNFYKSGNSDTLSLPLMDDFSATTNFPNDSIWVDRSVFINNTYVKEMITLGVATFDVLDENGDIYKQASTSSFRADQLTSKPINLYDYNATSMWGDKLFVFNTGTSTYEAASLSLSYKTLTGFSAVNKDYYYNDGDTLYKSLDQSVFTGSVYFFDSTSLNYKTFPVIKKYGIEDSVALSFYFQPQGLGDFPNVGDSLVVEIYLPNDSVWYPLFGVDGYTKVLDNPEFTWVYIPINHKRFFQNGVKIRFRNIGSITSNTDVVGLRSNSDFWHIDYVMLDKHRKNINKVSEFAFFIPFKSVLNEYQSMPYQHFLQPAAFNPLQKNDYTIGFRNFNSAKIIGLDFYFYSYNSYENIESTNYQFRINADMDRLVGDTTFQYVYPFDDDIDSIEFVFKCFVDKKSTDYFYSNDTITRRQIFHNYFAYDDGSAEGSYGLKGNVNGQVAYRFHAYKQDTLRAVDIYFVPPYDSIVRNTNFYLTVWKGENGMPGDVIYKEDRGNASELITPIYRGNNVFEQYKLNTPIVVEGDFFVGWTQKKDIYLSVGFDVNNIATDKLFYFINGKWFNSSQKGALMMRPVVGKEFPIGVGVDDVAIDQPAEIQIFPNPAKDNIYFNGAELYHHVYIYDASGKTVMEQELNTNNINISHLPQGFYIMRMINKDGGYYNHKFTIIK